MNAPDTIKAVMAYKGYSPKTLSERMGYSHASGITERLRAQRISLEVFCQIMDAMGCEVIIRDTAANEGEGKQKKKKEWHIELKEMPPIKRYDAKHDRGVEED